MIKRRSHFVVHLSSTTSLEPFEPEEQNGFIHSAQTWKYYCDQQATGRIDLVELYYPILTPWMPPPWYRGTFPREKQFWSVPFLSLAKGIWNNPETKSSIHYGIRSLVNVKIDTYHHLLQGFMNSIGNELFWMTSKWLKWHGELRYWAKNDGPNACLLYGRQRGLMWTWECVQIMR